MVIIVKHFYFKDSINILSSIAQIHDNPIVFFLNFIEVCFSK